jgi:predicted nucleic acid-binding Zn ribbon protein
MIELLLGAVLAAGAVSYVLRPILRPQGPEAGPGDADDWAAPACPTCGARHAADAQFCSQCGRRLDGGIARCPRCGAPLESGAEFCSACGAPVVS